MTKRRFHFELESVRTLRENVEQTVMKELAAELEQARELERRLALVEGRLAEARTVAPGGTAVELTVRQAYVERLERELGDARHRVRQQDRHVEAARTRLAHAVRERQTLDRLEQRRRASHQLELRRLERVDSDEISLVSHRSSEHAA